MANKPGGVRDKPPYKVDEHYGSFFYRVGYFYRVRTYFMYQVYSYIHSFITIYHKKTNLLAELKHQAPN